MPNKLHKQILPKTIKAPQENKRAANTIQRQQRRPSRPSDVESTGTVVFASQRPNLINDACDDDDGAADNDGTSD